MSIRAKSRRRLLGLLLGAALLLGAGGALYRHRERTLDERARSARAEGLAAFDHGDYGRAVGRLAHFMRRLEPDAFALMRYAQAILRAPAPDPEHVAAAVASLRHSIELEPENVEARRLLLDVYVLAHVRTEALEQAEWLLARDRSDEHALLAKARTLEQMSRGDEALAALEARGEGLGLEAELLRVRLAHPRRAAARVLADAEAVEARHRDDPRFRLVGAHARLLSGDVPGAREVLRPLAPLAMGDGTYAGFLVPNLEAVGLPREALEVLESLDREDLATGLDAHLLRRLWQAGRAPDVVARVAAWGVPLERLSTPALGHYTLAASRGGRPREAERGLAALAGRSTADARGWTRLLRDGVAVPAATVASRIAAALAAIEADARNAQSRFELGTAYLDAGEPELAVGQLVEASALDRAWAAPVALCANVLATTGRLDEAIGAAEAAGARESTDPGVAALLHFARAAAAATDGTLAERVLAKFEDAEGSAAILPFRLAVTAAAARPDASRALLEEILAGEHSGEILLTCVDVSRAQGLGLEERLLARYEALHGSTPALALRRAEDAAAARGAPAGLAVLRTASERAGEADRTAWLVGEARYLESHGEVDDAARAWGRVAERRPEEPPLLLALLDAASPWTDLGLVAGVVERLREATHPTCLRWRYHDARRLLAAERPSPADLARSVEHLRSVLATAPRETRARVLLARAYERSGQSKEAVEQLVIARGGAARDATPSSIPLDLEIARLHLLAGDGTAARETIRRMPLQAADPDSLLRAAALTVRLGEPDEAVALLDRLDDRPADAEVALRRAELYAAAGEPGRAEAVVGALVRERPSARALLFAAGLAHVRGRPEDEEALLARLPEALPDALERERAIARHLRRVGDLPAAERHFLAAIRLPGATAEDALALLASRVLQGRVDSGEDLAPRGAFDAPLLQSAVEHDDLRALAAAMVEDLPHRAAAESALRLLLAARAAPPSAADLARLRSLAHASPDFLALQVAAADLLVRERALDDAIGLARAAVDRFPSNPEPARALAYAQRAADRLDRAAEAAAEWRARLSGSKAAPDLFLAEQAESPAAAAALLERHVAEALERPVASVLLEYGRALLATGRAEDLRALLEPRLSDPALVKVWVFLAGAAARRGHAPVATEWLGHDAVARTAEARKDVLVEVAAAWGAVADETGSRDAREASRASAAAAERAPLTAEEWERIGGVHEANDDVGLAERAYRTALGLDAGRLFAANNLAMILARSGRAEEALPFARAVVGRQPAFAAFCDTLAFVQEKRGDLPEAERQLERCRELQPGNARWAQRLVRLILLQGDRSRATKTFEAFQARYSESRMPPDLRAQWSELGRTLRSGTGSQ